MRATLTVALVALCALQIVNGAEVQGWAQCGGTSCEGGGCSDAPWPAAVCSSGFSCVRQTQYYWQCAPHAALYAQCGGTSSANTALSGDHAWTGCPAGAECVRQSAFYYQCLPSAEVASPPQAAESRMRLKRPNAGRPIKSLTPRP
jgi:hypothetical protein